MMTRFNLFYQIVFLLIDSWTVQTGASLTVSVCQLKAKTAAVTFILLLKLLKSCSEIIGCKVYNYFKRVQESLL